MTATDTECMTLYLRLSVSQLAGLPAAVIEAWQRGQQAYYSRQRATKWPPEDRIDVVGHNGNDGQHYVEREPGPAAFGGRKTDRSRA